MNDRDADIVLDTTGLHSPFPVLKTKKAIDGLQTGKVLKVISTDQETKADIRTLLNRVGHKLLNIKEDDGTVEFYIKIK